MRRSWLVTLLALVASFAVAGSVLATHNPANHNVTTVLARGTLAANVHYNTDGIKVHTKGPVDVVAAEVTFAPGATAGWHSHPGPVFVVVKSGTISVWDEECVKRQYSAGDSFFEAGPDHPLLVKNESATTEVHAYVTFIAPAGAPALRLGQAHLCGLAE